MTAESLSIGDVVLFNYVSGIKEGKIVSLVNENNRVDVKIYCVDSIGGQTLTAPIYNILSIKVKESTMEEIKKPKRYNKKGKLECWDVILDQEMDFLEGSVLKYLWRYKEKNGVHDLEKAKIYIDKIIEGLKK